MSWEKEKEATLGIDFGSTSTRAYLWCLALKKGFNVENRDKKNFTSRFDKGDFSSTGYPFDEDGPIYMGEKVNPRRESISLKYAFYPLVDGSDEFIEQYRLAEPLMRRRNDQKFLDRLKQGLMDLFSRLFRRVNEVCGVMRLRVMSIGLSIPSQWELDFEDLYRGIVAEAFHHPSEDIFFITETEALAHFLCTDIDHRNHLVENRDHIHHDVVLVLDFGGHNMNTCVFNIVYGRGNTQSFYLIGKPDGRGGGSEQWEYLIGETCLELIQQAPGETLSAKAKQSILDDFNRQKSGLGPGQPDNFDLEVIGQTGTPWQVFLSPEKITSCFNEALKEPLALATEKIQQLAKMYRSQNDRHEADGEINKGRHRRQRAQPRVIVAGGTSKHEGLQSQLRDLCQSSGLPDPVFTDDIMVQYDSVKIAMGAAYAIARPLTVDQFMRRGAAFGLQMRQHATRGNSNAENEWDDRAMFLMSKRRQIKDLKINVTGRDELKIVCDPFFDDGNNADNMHCNKCYDILYLGQPTKGWWYFTLTLVGCGDNTSLTIERRSKRHKTKRKIVAYDSRTIPLYYNRGSNSIHLGEDGRDASEFLAGFDQYARADAGKRKNGIQVEDVQQPPDVDETSVNAPENFIVLDDDSQGSTHDGDSWEGEDWNFDDPAMLKSLNPDGEVELQSANRHALNAAQVDSNQTKQLTVHFIHLCELHSNTLLRTYM
ncbi:uncharacterized protein BCR38DRAFT_424659 [Pseudomassariella vexata]|uniref:Actin-like ATPase domain-containing protein n=1 Tax=Pseudomassariella vexata TaxID=1141098 RepID=A0A1Y2EBH9_9PEZI|nr:uncharacterized protein BCR38DRAFT_424659 [Pseudomassariella vexata]ORY68911.1 hypothetical protein BCR38DRAFT_424659 [Pseudomassariella vexata]